jgi:uncharacterized protein YjbI with pentapeptide repeats
MANEEHLALIKQGVKVWNEWRETNREIKPDLSKVNLYGANLSRANLSRANLYRANLSRANLSKANLSRVDLIGANFIGANLSRVDLVEANLYGANLIDANLSRANLSGINLVETDLIDANLIDANLSRANLSRIQALKTNFEKATFTGACIEDWNINSETNLNDVICDYVYLKQGKQERRPHDSNKNFAPGEFTQLFQKALETVDLIFSDGIDWKAFLSSFGELKVKYGKQNLSVQAIEQKNDNTFVIRLNVPSDADKAEIESQAKELYEKELKYLEAQYRAELNAKDKEIEIYKQQSANILELAKLAASRPINISQTQGNNMAGDRNIQMGSGNYNERIEGDYVQGNYYASEQKETLAEAAAEIQRLLKQLEETNPTATIEQQQAFVDAAVSPTLKARFVNALQAGWKEAVKEFLDNPYVNVGVSILEGWQEAE